MFETILKILQIKFHHWNQNESYWMIGSSDERNESPKKLIPPFLDIIEIL